MPDAGPARASRPRASSRDPDEVAAYDADPLVYRGKLPARTLQELADTIGALRRRARRGSRCRCLVQLGMADRDRPAGRRPGRCSSALGSQDKTLIPYEGYFHEIYNEPRRRARPPAGRPRAPG